MGNLVGVFPFKKELMFDKRSCQIFTQLLNSINDFGKVYCVLRPFRIVGCFDFLNSYTVYSYACCHKNRRNDWTLVIDDTEDGDPKNPTSTGSCIV
jgi:hypothetical protein